MAEEEVLLHKHSIPEVPWLGFDHDVQEHALVDFAEYPLRRGWSKDQIIALKHGDALAFDDASCLAMLQSWLVFGFLEGIYKRRFSSSQYVVDTASGRVVDTTQLRQFFDKWHGLLQQESSESMLSYWRYSTIRLYELHSWYAALEKHCTQGIFPTAFDTAEYHSIMRLVVLIADSIYYNKTSVASRLIQIRSGLNWHHTEVNGAALRTRLIQKGWCPSLHGLFMTYGLAFTEYASLLDATDGNVERHNRCADDAKCLGVNYLGTGAGPKHIANECHCQIIRPSSSQMNGIISNNKIPLIDLGSLSPLMSDCPVVEWDQQQNFIAFSHVWVDGLSSESEIGLPLCQLRNLQNVLFQVGPSSLIWVDALCIPHEPTIRNLAIDMMAEVYKRSTAIIILDAGLRSRPLGKFSTAELAVRLLTCNWMQRLWTLPEILFSQRAFVAFQDGVIDLNILRSRLRQMARFPIECVGFCTLLRFVHEDGTEGLKIGEVQRLLASRNSSRPDDETLAIAPLLDLSAANLIGYEGQDRMVQFWRQLREVPRVVVLLVCPRLDVPGFTWAPQSLISTSGNVPMNQEYGSATVTQLGLRGTFFIYELKTRRILGNAASFIIDPKAQHFIAFRPLKHKFDRAQTYPYPCDGIVLLEESRNALKRSAITVITDPALGSSIVRYKYGRQIVLDFSPLPVSQELSANFSSIGKYQELTIS